MSKLKKVETTSCPECGKRARHLREPRLNNSTADDYLRCRACGFTEPLVDSLRRELKQTKNVATKSFHEVEQTLGKALGYPWFKDDQKNFPGATKRDGVCVGEHVPETIAQEAAKRLKDAGKDAKIMQGFARISLKDPCKGCGREPTGCQMGCGDSELYELWKEAKRRYKE